MSYFEERCHKYGITEKNNYVAFKGNEKITTPIFEEDKKGNIRIHYYDLKGHQYHYKISEDKWPQRYWRTRLCNPTDDKKYVQPKGSPNFPFFTPGLITKYLHEKSFETLCITEGEFKAFYGYLCGLDIGGFPSIQGSYERGTYNTLHHDIKELIQKCGVKNIVFITDADTMTINYREDKDLSLRPASFYAAIRNFYEACKWLIEDKHCPLKHAYWCHIRTEYLNTGKGLDDLLMYYQAKQNEIIEELQKQHFDQFFNGYHLSEAKIKALRKEFGIQDINNFYNVYKDFIGNREFRWKRSRYQYDGEKIEYLRHEDADKFFRVASDWYKIIKKPNSYGQEEEIIIPYKVGEINRDYRKYPEFLDQVPKYDWFFSEPCWNDNYKRVKNNCLNVMSPLAHKPKEGCIDTSLKFVKHLFDNNNQIRTYHFCDIETRKEIKHTIVCEEEGSQLTVALDMMAIMFQKPCEKLPVLCLVSPEEGTGKSTFLYWQQAIYGNNAVVLDNERFRMQFNSHYVTKFFVGLDEGSLEVEKKTEKERLKQMITAKELPLEEKGVNIKFITNYIHLIICSNDADRIMYMDENDSRWFVVRVQKVTTENPILMEYLKKEIPAWLHFLQHRKIIHPKVSRLWFKKEWMVTEQMRAIINNTKPKLDRLIEEIIKDMFLTYELLALDIQVQWLVDIINKEFRYKVSRTDVIDYFKNRRNINPATKTERIKIPISYDVYNSQLGTEPKILYHEVVCKPYHLKIEDWVDQEDEIKSILKKHHIKSGTDFSS